jgi:TPR repeat protein
MKQIVIALLLWGLQFNADAAGADAIGAYMRGDYTLALRQLAPLVRAGDRDADFLLGLMYYAGNGVARDHHRAFDLLHKAACLGKSDAEYIIGVMFYVGDSVPKDERLAQSWFRKASEQGNAGALYALGLMYRYGVTGVAQDIVMAYVLWSLSAAQGNRYAKYQLASAAKFMNSGQISEGRRLASEWAPGRQLPQVKDKAKYRQ